MKQRKINIFVVLFAAFLFALVLPTSLMAQSESYLDTIYRAVDGSNNTYLSDYETDTEIYVDAEVSGATAAAPDNTSTSTGTSTNTSSTTSSNPVIKDGKIDVNVVLADMTRILIGMNTGLSINTSSFTIIDMGNGTSTESSTSSSTSGSTSTDTGSTTNTGSETNTSPSTSTDSGTTTTTTATDSGSNTGTTTSPSEDPGLNPGTTTPTSTSTDTGSQTNPFDEDTTVTTTQTTSDTGTTTSTDSKEEIDNLKAKIESNYGVPVAEGNSNFTVRQLELMDDTFAKMKAKNSTAVNDFMKSTTKIIRDKSFPTDANTETTTNPDNVMGYVVRGETVVHLLDRASTLSEKDITELEKLNKRKFSQAQLVKHVEEDYVHTIIHEMTHAFQNSQAAKGNDIAAKWQAKFWDSETQVKSDGTPPSAYAKTSPREDMAECVAFYVTGGGVKYTNAEGKEVFKANNFAGSTMDIERYNWIKDNIFNGVEFLDPNNGTINF